MYTHAVILYMHFVLLHFWVLSWGSSFAQCGHRESVWLPQNVPFVSWTRARAVIPILQSCSYHGIIRCRVGLRLAKRLSYVLVASSTVVVRCLCGKGPAVPHLPRHVLAVPPATDQDRFAGAKHPGLDRRALGVVWRICSLRTTFPASMHTTCM